MTSAGTCVAAKRRCNPAAAAVPHLQSLLPRISRLLLLLLLQLRQPLAPRLLEGGVSGAVCLRCCRLARELLLVAAVLRCERLLAPAGRNRGAGQSLTASTNWVALPHICLAMFSTLPCWCSCCCSCGLSRP